jgi:hypothetical protein
MQVKFQNPNVVPDRSDERAKTTLDVKSIRRLAVILVSALAFVACGGQTASPSVSPVAHDPAINLYQGMVQTDEAKVIDSQSSNCITLRDACPAAAAAVIGALQRWLDDLNRSQPPARFAYVDAQMRRHVALCIGDLNTAVSAYRAKNQDGMNTAISAAISERDTFDVEVSDIITSGQGTIADYTSVIQADKANLLVCAICEPLVSQNQVSCPPGQTPSCVDEIAAIRLRVEKFQNDLVRVLAPDSLAAKDGRLQSDLFTADVALGAMASALSAVDLVALQDGDNALRQALGRTDSDAAAIVKS